MKNSRAYSIEPQLATHPKTKAWQLIIEEVGQESEIQKEQPSLQKLFRIVRVQISRTGASYDVLIILSWRGVRERYKQEKGKLTSSRRC